LRSLFAVQFCEYPSKFTVCRYRPCFYRQISFSGQVCHQVSFPGQVGIAALLELSCSMQVVVAAVAA
jgi:hypothetical protein